MFHTTSIKPETERARLALLIALLNAGKDGKRVPGYSKAAVERLSAYAESWRECAPNAIVWRDSFPDHWKALCRSLKQTQLILYPVIDGCIAAWDVRSGITTASDLWRVDKLFADFLVGFHDRIAVCRRDDCGKYFVRTSKRTTYCSDNCGNTATSKVAKSAKRHNERHAKLLSVLSFFQKQDDPAAGLEHDESVWKEWVTRNVKKVTARWLNEAVLEQLKAPEAFANCDRCREIRGQIQTILDWKGKQQ